MNFGWLPEKRSYKTADITIEPLPNFDEALSTVQGHSQNYKNWLYPPLEVFSQDKQPKPSIPSVWFSLPATHKISIADKEASADFEEFLIIVFGWAKGLLLRPDGHGHFYKAATSSGQLCDFFISKSETIALLNFAARFWDENKSSKIRNLMFGAIHWHLFSFSYCHAFERFMTQYTVFDSIWKINEILRPNIHAESHASRLIILAELHDLYLPKWAELITKKQSRITKIRNELIHEAQFYGKPIGFAVPPSGSNINLEFEAFNSRLLAATLGAVGPYTRSPCDTQQIHSFDID